MPWFIMDYQKDTMHLTLEEDGLYRRMLDMHWLTKGKGLPDDDLRLANTLRVDMPTWLRLKPMMAPFFQIANGVWLNRSNYAEYLGRVAVMETAIEKSKAGVEARRRKAQAQAEVELEVQPQVALQVEPEVNPGQYQSESESNPTPKAKAKQLLID